MDSIKEANIRDIKNQYVNPDYKSGFSMERGKFRGLTGRERRKAREIAALIDQAFEMERK